MRKYKFEKQLAHNVVDLLDQVILDIHTVKTMLKLKKRPRASASLCGCGTGSTGKTTQGG